MIVNKSKYPEINTSQWALIFKDAAEAMQILIHQKYE
jgi:hypothetical protein